MKNIFIEYKKLKNDIDTLQKKIENIQSENTKDIIRVQEYYSHLLEKRINEIEEAYNKKLKRKDNLINVISNLENTINKKITAFIDIDITTDIENYIKLLKCLKED